MTCLPGKAEAEQIFRQYRECGDRGGDSPLVRDAEAVEPLIRKHPRPACVSKDGCRPRTPLGTLLTTTARPFGLLAGTLPDFSQFSAYLVISENQLRLDWKATTGYGTATLRGIGAQSGRPRGNPRQDPSRGFLHRRLSGSGVSELSACFSGRQPGDLVLCPPARIRWLASSASSSCGRHPRNPTPKQQKITVRLDHGPAGCPAQPMVDQRRCFTRNGSTRNQINL